MKTLIVAGTFFLLLFTPSLLTAQGFVPFMPGDPAQEAPVDGGLGILAVIGGAYAVKKLRKKE